jgi:glutathione peroxidase
MKDIDGKDVKLKKYKGNVLLVVNTASKCGYTPQYEGLQAIYSKYHEKGFEILGFPANNFGGQEPGSEAEIKEFCTLKYKVTFPMFAKISVKGDDQHPLYGFLTAERADPDISNGKGFEEKLAGFDQSRANDSDILWNFEKFLISKDGEVAARISPDVTAEDPRVIEAVKAELK